MITCACNKLYIGKTKRKLSIRFGEHIREMNEKEPKKPLARHFKKYHGGDPRGMTIKGIYALHLSPRRGDFDKVLMRKEKWWIFTLSSLTPNGLNTEMNWHVFLDE